jgi:sugar phosphate permease
MSGLDQATGFNPDVNAEAGASPSPTWVRWRIMGLLMAFSFMNHFNRVSMALAGDERIMHQYGISPPRMGVVYSAFLITYTIAMTPGGSSTGSARRRR